MINLVPEEISKLRLISRENRGVHVGWWVVWLLLFWPALLVVAMIHCQKVNHIKVEFKNGDKNVYIVDDASYSYLMLHCE